jgi:hypothetical protein
MACKELVVALSLIVAAAPVAAAPPPSTPAPTAGPDARYCMRVGPLTGSLIERVKCWTRAKWAEQGVDVDKEWAKEGVAVLEP